MTSTQLTLEADRVRVNKHDDGSYELILWNTDSKWSWNLNDSDERSDDTNASNKQHRITGTSPANGLVEQMGDLTESHHSEVLVTLATEDGNTRDFIADLTSANAENDGNTIKLALKAAEPDKPDPIIGNDNNSIDYDWKDYAMFSLSSGAWGIYKVLSGRKTSSITFFNKTEEKMQVSYVIGDLEANAIVQKVDLPSKSIATVSGKTWKGWDISARVDAWNASSFHTGLTVQASDPYIGDPVIGINMTGNSYKSVLFGKKEWKSMNIYKGEGWQLTKPAIAYVVANGKNDTNWFVQLYPQSGAPTTFADVDWLWN